METEIINLRKKVNNLNYVKKNLSNEIEKNEEKINELKNVLETCIKARWVLSEVVENTQGNFKRKVENLTTIALRVIFDRNFEFKFIFEKKGNKIGARPVTLEDGEEFIPKDEMGGSILNVIGFMMQIIFIVLEKPNRRKTLFLDEPFHWLGDYKKRAATMLKEISEKLGIQILLVTHDIELAEIADVIYHVKIKDKKSKVELYESRTRKFNGENNKLLL